MANLIGQSLGRYHILEQLGEGGMATVYKAYDTPLERQVAIKFIRTDIFGSTALARILKRFEREAKAVARLNHPNIIGVIDYGEYDGMPYLVMEYVPGGTLKEQLGEPVPWRQAIQRLLPIARALAYAHSHRLVHRDIKPSNILITETGESMLTDFGIAKLLETEDSQTMTATGLGIGTPEYMAPEQGMGQKIDARADIYSLGIVLYELVTGRRPYRADTPMAVIFKHVNDPLPRPKEFVPNLPDEMENILIKALAKDPAARYQEMGEFVAALERISQDKQPLTGTVIAPKMPGNAKWLWLGGLATLLVLLGIIWLISRTLPTREVEENATETVVMRVVESSPPVASPTEISMMVETETRTQVSPKMTITATYTLMPSRTPTRKPTAISTATKVSTVPPEPTSTPVPAYDEARVRYIIADIQMSGLDGYYRSFPNDPHAVEAVRRWDGGVRVTNIADFDYKITSCCGWAVVYKGTETPINGMDARLTTDP